MKTRQLCRTMLALILVLLLFCIFVRYKLISPAADAELPVASLPRSLQTVEDEAFVGTAFCALVFDGELTYIGDRAFSAASRLTKVYLPETVSFIGRDAFPDFSVIHGVEASYAQEWAEQNGYQFVTEDIWNAPAIAESVRLEHVLVLLWLVIPAYAPGKPLLHKRLRVFEKSMKPCDRPELYPIDYRFP